MRRIIYIFGILSLIVSSISAQTDPVAFSILEKFSKRALDAGTIAMNFDMQIVDAVEETESSSEGSIIIKGDNYKLTVPENIIWYDGEAIYTLVPEVEEVTITEPDSDDEAFMSSPTLLFTLYREGYKIRMITESPNESVIDLYPDNIENDVSRIRLNITKDYSLKGVEYKRKDGITITLTISEYTLGKSYKDDFFKFDEKKYRNVDVIDMRF